MRIVILGAPGSGKRTQTNLLAEKYGLTILTTGELVRRAAGLIGNGLYGVDLKQIGNRVVVIEVNDNPSIESGVEDGVMKEALYREIVGTVHRGQHLAAEITLQVIQAAPAKEDRK
jgi:broad-specificity NMP kinase